MERNADEGGILRGGVKGDPASWRVVPHNTYCVKKTKRIIDILIQAKSRKPWKFMIPFPKTFFHHEKIAIS